MVSMRLVAGLRLLGACLLLPVALSCDRAGEEPSGREAEEAPAGILAVASGEAVVVLEADGGGIRTLEVGATFQDVDLAPGGRSLAYATEDGLAVLDLPTRAVVPVAPAAGVAVEPAFGASGTTLYFLRAPAAAEPSYDLWSLEPDGRSVRHTRTANLSMVAVSPDERRIAFVRDFLPGGLGTIYLADRSAAGARELATGAHPSFSPDGRTLAFATERGVEVVGVDGGTPRLVVEGGDHPAFSPDGRWIAFLRDAACPDDGYCRKRMTLVPASGGRAREIGPELDQPGRLAWVAGEASADAAPFGLGVVASYCSPSGDLCYGVRIEGRRLSLALDAHARYFDRYRLCVRGPTREQRCRGFSVGRRGQLYGSSVAWAASFPDEGAGIYQATWLLGSTRLGPPLRFRLG